jgi:hypothetical protein
MISLDGDTFNKPTELEDRKKKNCIGCTVTEKPEDLAERSQRNRKWGRQRVV